MTPRHLIFTLVVLSLTTTAGASDDDTQRIYLWSADREHSSIFFETGHWGIVDIVGWFEDFEITVRSSALDFSDARVDVRIDPASVRMPNPEMAANLRALFLETETFPEIVFRGTSVETTEQPGLFKLSGALTMKAVEREITVTVLFNGYGTPPQGAPGFKIEGVINRLDYGAGDMVYMEGTGLPMVDAEVRITGNIRLEYIRSEYER